jgi:cystinosin
LILDCKDLHDFSAITGNFAKFGLGSISICFDIIFMLQHYVLYAESETTDEQQPLLSEDEREASRQGSEEVEV